MTAQLTDREAELEGKLLECAAYIAGITRGHAESVARMWSYTDTQARILAETWVKENVFLQSIYAVLEK